MLKVIALVTVLLVPSIVLAQKEPMRDPAKDPAKTAKTPPAKTPAPTTQPTIVLVHGAWADGSSWDKVMPMLTAKGYNVVAVHLPLTSVSDDVAAANRAIDKQPGDVVLVGHSYGGLVITQAGNNPKVKKLVYVDAFGLDEGETVGALLKTKPPAWLKTLQVDSGGFAWLPPEGIAKDFVPELPEAEQKLVLAKQGPVPMKGFDEVTKNPAWKNKPSFYLRGTKDRIIDPAAQAQMAKRMKATTINIESGHVPMLSKPREVASIILEAAGAPAAAATR